MPVQDLSRYYAALKNADAAGDTAAATQLAKFIRSQTNPPEPIAPPEPMSPIAQSAYQVQSALPRAAQGAEANVMAAHPELDPRNRTEPLLEEGIGSGLTRFTRGGGNLLVHALNKVLPDDRAVKGGWFSDEAVREQDELDKPLSQTTEGGIGQMIGQTAASLPLSMGLGAASTAARATPYVGRLLGSTLGRAGVEGAVDAAAVSDVDEQGKAAAEGAGLGATLSALGGVGGRFISGLVKKSQEAKDLEQLAGQQGRKIFTPVSQAGEEDSDLLSRGLQTLYREGLTLIPGVSGQIRSQARGALNTVREMALQEATPEGISLAAGSGADGITARREIKNAINDTIDKSVGQYTFSVPQDFKAQVAARIKAAMPDVDSTTLEKVSDAIDAHMQRFSSGEGQISGKNLLNAQTFSKNISGLEGPEKEALQHGLGAYDNLMEEQLGNKEALPTTNKSQAAESADALSRYRALQEPMENFEQLQAAIEAAKPQMGQFTPEQLGRASTDPGTMLHLATTAQKVLGKRAIQPSSEGKLALYGIGGYSLAAHPLASPVAAGAMFLGANVLATKTAQRFVMGDTVAQKAIAKMLAEHPEMAARVGMLMRNAATTQVGASNAGP